MTGAGKYAELAAAVRCFKADLIRTTEIERVIESGSLSETVSMLTRRKSDRCRQLRPDLRRILFDSSI